MKKILLLTLLMTTLVGFSQHTLNDYQATVATASNGKYNEFPTNDTLIRIGKAIFNTNTNKVVGFVITDTLYSEATLEPELVSRWMSPDPLEAKYPGMSPYNSMGNNPIFYIDPDGGENVIYLVSLKTEEGYTDVKVDYKKVAERANAMYEKLGVKTRVVVFTGTKEEFNSSYMDKTDGVAYVGNPIMLNKEVLSPAGKIGYRGGPFDPLDLSEMSGSFITVSLLAAQRYQFKLNVESIEETVAFGIVHGSSHNAKSGHTNNNPDYEDLLNDGDIGRHLYSYAMDGFYIGGLIQNYGGTLDDFFDPKQQPKTIEKHKQRFGEKDARVNYEYKKLFDKFGKHIFNLGIDGCNPKTVDEQNEEETETID